KDSSAGSVFAKPPAMSDLDTQIMSFLSYLDDREKQRLIDVLGRKGAEHCLILLDSDINELHALDGVRRAFALSLRGLPEERVREIYERNTNEADLFNLTEKKAGA
ncbi:hypothetical protein SLM85_004672, partial [Salmonella enterica]|nr:hypothetical protein [Salmonella enterica]